MNELLNKINETIDNSIQTSSDEVGLQLRILKGNINTLFNEAMQSNNSVSSEVIDNSNKKSILIVDDSSIIRNYLQKAIGDKYNTVLVDGGAKAIESLSSSKFDLVLLDLMMPGIDGFGVLDNIKSNGICVPVIIISGDTTKETIDRAFTYNVVDMIEKPFSDRVIVDKIDRVLA